jgi:hypothetical protein
MSQSKHTSWTRHLDGMADELLHLSIACDVRVTDAETVERIIKGDETVCGRRNPIGFQKLRSLVMATYDSLNKAIDRIGPAETKMIADAISERIDHQRAVGQSGSGLDPATPDGEKDQ